MAKRAEKVLFLVHRTDDSPVFAVFPHIVGTNDPATMTCYEHVGQHGTCHMDYVKECRLAGEDEYLELKAELERIGYVLDVQTASAGEDFHVRVRELEAMNV